VKVVLNSDITFLPDLIREGLGRQVSALAEACREHKFDLALPLTTVMEFQRQQEEYAEQERRKLDDATALLDRLGVPHDPVDSATLIEIRALSDLFSEAGSSVEVVNPTFEDFMEAHRRACLHLSPQPRTGKGGPDEMRDLVVWCLAVRISREVGGNLAEVLTNTVHTMRERAQLRGLVRVLSAEGRISAKVLIGLPFALAGYLLAFKPGYLDPLVNTAVGIIMLVFGSTLLLLGSFWLSRLVKIEV